MPSQHDNSNKQVDIDASLAVRLVNAQFPQWRDLPIKPVVSSGWDNRTFHLGDTMLMRMPSGAAYASQVAKEQKWLPILAPHLPLSIPNPIAMGKPSDEYPWSWSIYHWLEGSSAAHAQITDLTRFAETLAAFLMALQHCDTEGAPIAGPENFYRGGDLSIYDADTQNALTRVQDKHLAKALSAIWEKALASTWQQAPVWIHGDIASGNCLINNGELVAVIDFGQLAIGDPACDLAIYWTMLSGQSRHRFRQCINLDADTWDRARGWVLWKTLCAPIAGTDCKQIFTALVNDNLNL